MLVRFIRRLLRRTPPQREAGWVLLSVREPQIADTRRELVEIYKASEDTLFNAYYWSLPAIHGRDRENYYWRKIDNSLAPPDRHFQYFLRSKTLFR